MQKNFGILKFLNFSMALDQIFGNIDMIVVRVKGLRDGSLKLSGLPIQLSEINPLPLPIFPIAVMEEHHLRPIAMA